MYDTDEINWEAVRIKFIHSSGPGGQNVNKVATAAQLRYDLSLSGLTDEQIERLKALVPGQITRDGVLVITARNHRGQGLNRQEAYDRLTVLLRKAKAPPPKPRKATRPTRGSTERRLETKKKKSLSKAARAAVRFDD